LRLPRPQLSRPIIARSLRVSISAETSERSIASAIEWPKLSMATKRRAPETRLRRIREHLVADQYPRTLGRLEITSTPEPSCASKGNLCLVGERGSDPAPGTSLAKRRAIREALHEPEHEHMESHGLRSRGASAQWFQCRLDAVKELLPGVSLDPEPCRAI